jgi:tRNA uridine 5-carbamoylmethylation protein Kti12
VLITVRIQKDMLVRRNKKKCDFTYWPNNLVRQHYQQINSSNSYHKVHKMTKYKSAKP